MTEATPSAWMKGVKFANKMAIIASTPPPVATISSMNTNFVAGFALFKPAKLLNMTAAPLASIPVSCTTSFIALNNTYDSNTTANERTDKLIRIPVDSTGCKM
ncbi:hypothetical protein SRABI133_05206 [Peribacillus simplex]|uniref:Uncharacterized protein n=1 Tax=Peribacillus simplex TaxID=1478 RepID=A0A9W4L7Y7_9BACI|nr:hypothetical protein SRABI133_05206 [Peribacillus simplex]